MDAIQFYLDPEIARDERPSGRLAAETNAHDRLFVGGEHVEQAYRCYRNNWTVVLSRVTQDVCKSWLPFALPFRSGLPSAMRLATVASALSPT